MCRAPSEPVPAGTRPRRGSGTTGSEIQPHFLRQPLENLEVRLDAHGGDRPRQPLHFAAHAGHGAGLLVSAGRGQHDVGPLRRLGEEQVLDHDESIRGGQMPRPSADWRPPPTSTSRSGAASISGKARPAFPTRHAGPCPRRPGNSGSPPGRRTSPGCRANRRTPPVSAPPRP